MARDLTAGAPAPILTYMRTIVIEDLTADEKLELIGELWESLDQRDVSLTASQKEEIDRRLDSADADGGSCWEDVERRLEQRLR